MQEADKETSSLAQTEVARCKARINGKWAKDNANKYQTFRRDCYEHGESTGRGLAKKIRCREVKDAITALKKKETRRVNNISE